MMLVMAVALAACVKTVSLYNPQTEEGAICGPYSTTGLAAQAGAALLIDCINDFEARGFLRRPSPN